MRLGNLYCDPLMVHGGHKITARQRWTPTQMQLQILESIFDQGNGTPSKQKIKDITSELSQHGQISETNVYNWFQNRRARSKRKQAASLPNNAESEAEADEESPTDKKPKSDGPQQQNMAARSHNVERISELHHHFDTEHEHGTMYGSNNDNSSRSSGSLGQMSFYETIMSNPSMCLTNTTSSFYTVQHLIPSKRESDAGSSVQEWTSSWGRRRPPGTSPSSGRVEALTCMDDTSFL